MAHPSSEPVQPGPLRNVRGQSPMKASPAQQIISEHEAGMHEKRTKDSCRSCQKEIQEMAKQKVTCEFDGGSYDGTPSGKAKHEATSKHFQAQNPAPLATPGTIVTAEAVVSGQPTLGKVKLSDRLSLIIQNREQELARRQVDHKWRVANRPAEADAYFESKITPVLFEIDTLRQARTIIAD